jgi:hypothetical protein
MSPRNENARHDAEPFRPEPLSTGGHSESDMGASRDSRFPVPPDPNYSEIGGAYQGDIPVDIHGRRLLRSYRGKKDGGQSANDRLLDGVNRGIDEIVARADRDPNVEAARLIGELTDAFQRAWSNRRNDPDLVANLIAAWAVNGHPDLPRDLNAQWSVLFAWFYLKLKAKVDRGVTPEERREKLRERVAELPPSVSNREAEKLLRHEGWNVSDTTIGRIRRDGR